MPAKGAPVVLRHLAKHRLLLCVTCEYCVLSQALDSHLKSIHRLPLAQRHRYLKAAQSLRLASLEDVVSPNPGESPISGLAQHKGYACEAPDCTYLSVTTKRMHAHWTNKHARFRQLHGVEKYRCRSVRLQTFFRGSYLQYFIVSGKPITDRGSLISGEPPPLVKLPTEKQVEDPIDWLLLKQFVEYSFDALRPTKGTHPSWKSLVLQRCSVQEFLRFAVLGATACHIAYEYPASRCHYTREADRYRFLAVKAIPVWTTEEEIAQFFTHFNFLRLMGLNYICREQLSLLEDPRLESSRSARPVLAEWIPISRRGRELWFRHRGQGRLVYAMNGPERPLKAVWEMPEHYMALNPYNGRLGELIQDLELLPSYEVNAECVEALRLLQRVWALPFKNDVSSFRDMALMWIARVPEKFFDLVRHHDPVALVVLAHHCVLWSQSEACFWYMRHHAEEALFRIVQQLPWEWQEWIAWPVSAVFRLNDDSASPTTVRETKMLLA